MEKQSTELTDEERRLVEAYNGSIEESAKAAGLSRARARRMAAHPRVVEAMAERIEKAAALLVTDRRERQTILGADDAGRRRADGRAVARE